MRLADLQERLYAEGRRSLLVVLQAMDAAGKDGTIDHVMSGLNPQGVSVTSFKQPTPVELAHDFLWRTQLALPARGRIGVFNRSHYEEVLVVRVHPEYLGGQGIDPERGAARRLGASASRTSAPGSATSSATGTRVVKFFLNVSRTSSASASSRAPRRRTRTGSSRPATSPSARTGTPTRRPTRRRCARRAPPTRPGTSSPPTTSGSRAPPWRRSSPSTSRTMDPQYPEPVARGPRSDGHRRRRAARRELRATRRRAPRRGRSARSGGRPRTTRGSRGCTRCPSAWPAP